MVMGTAVTKAAADQKVAVYQSKGYVVVSPPALDGNGRWRFALDK